MDILAVKKNLTSGDPCRIFPFGSHSKASCSDLLLFGKLAMKGKTTIKKIYLKVEEAKYSIGDTLTLESRIKVDSPCEIKCTSFLFEPSIDSDKDAHEIFEPCLDVLNANDTSLADVLYVDMHVLEQNGVVFHELRPCEKEVVQHEHATTTEGLLNQVVSFHYPLCLNYF